MRVNMLYVWDRCGSTLLFLLLGIYSVYQAQDLPGLYLDAVNPDYLAVQVLYPQQYSVSWSLPFVGMPLLGQLYHGTVTMFMSILAICFTGSTSVLQLHFLNMLYGFFSCVVLYNILRKLGTSPWIVSLVIAALMLSPNLTSWYRMQFYIELPGVCFSLIAVYFLLKWMDDDRKSVLLALSGFFAGLAFYDYFNFIFFVPAYLVFLWIISREKGLQVLSAFTYWAVGAVTGGSLFILAYVEIILLQIPNITPLRVMEIAGSIMLLVYLSLCGIYYYLKRTGPQAKKSVIVLFWCVFIILVGVLLLRAYPVIAGNLQNLHVEGIAVGVADRFFLLFNHCYAVMTNSLAETLMLGQACSSYTGIMLILTIGTFILSFLLGLVRGFRKEQWFAISFMIAAFLYCVCTFPMASRMWAQHFVFFLFIEYAVLAISLNALWRMLDDNKLVLAGMVVVLLSVCAMNFADQSVVMARIEQSGGVAKFSSSINSMSSEALQLKYDGEKNIYFFPEWGFMCGFDYLTRNQVPFSAELNPKFLQQVQREGYNIKVCYWDDKKTEEYRALLQDCLNSEVNDSVFVNKMGEPTVHVLEYKNRLDT